MKFSNSYYKKIASPPLHMFTQAFFEAKTLYLSNLKRKLVPLSCTRTPPPPPHSLLHRPVKSPCRPMLPFSASQSLFNVFQLSFIASLSFFRRLPSLLNVSPSSFKAYNIYIRHWSLDCHLSPSTTSLSFIYRPCVSLQTSPFTASSSPLCMSKIRNTFVSISRLTGKCAAQKFENFCSFTSQNKITELLTILV